jgi:hypothetical protein
MILYYFHKRALIRIELGINLIDRNERKPKNKNSFKFAHNES